MGCGTVRGTKQVKNGDSPIKENKVFIRKRVNEQFSTYFNKTILEECQRLEDTLKNKPRPARLQQTLDEADQQTLLDLIRVGRVEKVLAFFNSGNNISILEEIGNKDCFWTSLHFASYYGHSELLGHLIAALYKEDMENFEENLNYQTREGFSLLSIACLQNQHLCALQLLKHGGIYLDPKDVANQAALDHANYFNNYEVLCAILQNSKNCHEINLQAIRDADKKLDTPDYSEIISSLERKTDRKKIQDNGDLPTDQGPLGTIRYRGEKAREIMRQCSKMHRKFIDNDFPHENQSVESHAGQFNDIVWLRPFQINKVKETEIDLFNKMDPYDIKHGYSNISNLNAIIYAISEHPQRVMLVFNNLDTNLYNIYSVQYYIDGKPMEIFVDDFIPCVQHLNTPLFMRIKSPEIYPYLLEKAYAKVFKNYFTAITMDPETVLEEFFGAPVRSYWIQDMNPEKIYSVLHKALQKKQVVILVASKDCHPDSGLHPGFIYPLVKCHDVDGKQVLKLKDIYGRHDWQSEYNPTFNDWLAEKSENSHFAKDADDGFLYLSAEDIQFYFYYISVSGYQPNHVYNYLELECTYRKAQYVSFKVEEPMRVCIRMHQKKFSTFQRVDFKLIKEENNGQISLQTENLEDNWKGRRTINVSSTNSYLTLQPSVYYLRIKFLGTQQEENIPIIISSYSEKFLKLKVEEKQQGQFVFKQYLKSRVFSKPSVEQWNSIGYIHHDLDSRWLQVIGIHNQGQERIRATLRISENQNVYLKGEKKRQTQVIEIEPQKKQISVIKFRDLDQNQTLKWKVDFEAVSMTASK